MSVNAEELFEARHGASREEFFEAMHGPPNFRYVGYDEIGLRTERVGGVHWDGLEWHQIDTKAHVSTNLWLPNPMTTAAMNCIGGDDMGIAMAMSGGAATIHHINTPDEQKDLAQNVYHFLSGIIEKPVTTSAGSTVRETSEALDKILRQYRTEDGSRSKRKQTFHTLPVLDDDGRCIGVMDSLAFKLANDRPEMTVREAMHPLTEEMTAESGLDAQEVWALMKARKVGRIVLLNEKGELGGLCLIDDIMRVVNSNPEQYSLSDGRLIVMASVPTIVEDALLRADKLKDYVKALLIDTSHGEQTHALDTLRALKKANLGVDIIAGNISTEQAAIEVAKLEPDGISVGQGPGSICKSSDRLGYGTPQASAVYEVARGAHSVNPNIPVIADGGIREPADTIKALACGASAVRVGSLVAGTDEQPVEAHVTKEGVWVKPYWGMGSLRAQRDWKEARARYGNYRPFDRIFIEGFETEVPLKGSVSDVLADHVMGLKMSMMGQGFANIEDVHKYARFMFGNNRK